MKIFSLVGALAFVSFSAHATSPIMYQQEVLTKVEINGTPTKYVGVLNLDFFKNEIKVELYNDICNQFTAKPNEITCMAMAELITTIEAPLQTRGTSCGSAVYEGELDLTPRDGFHTKMKVWDHSNRLCKDKVAGEVEVTASQFNPWTQTTTNYYLVK
jgi:hypothetical protein